MWKLNLQAFIIFCKCIFDILTPLLSVLPVSSMANPQGILGPLGDLTTETFDTGFLVLMEAKKHTVVKFVDLQVYKNYGASRAHVAVSDVTISFSGSCYAALIPDSWSAPTTDDPAKGIGLCMAPSMTTTYTPRERVDFPVGVSQILHPKTLTGEPPSLLLFSPNAGTVLVKFKFHVHGIRAIKPW